eukprot:759749_1
MKTERKTSYFIEQDHGFKLESLPQMDINANGDQCKWIILSNGLFYQCQGSRNGIDIANAPPTSGSPSTESYELVPQESNRFHRISQPKTSPFNLNDIALTHQICPKMTVISYLPSYKCHGVL